MASKYLTNSTTRFCCYDYKTLNQVSVFLLYPNMCGRLRTNQTILASSISRVYVVDSILRYQSLYKPWLSIKLINSGKVHFLSPIWWIELLPSFVPFGCSVLFSSDNLCSLKHPWLCSVSILNIDNTDLLFNAYVSSRVVKIMIQLDKAQFCAWY